MAEYDIFPEFRNEFASTRYPFADNATLLAQDGVQAIPDELFTDAAIYPIGGQARAYLSQIVVTARLVTLTISDPAGQSLCTGSFDPIDPPAVIQLSDAFGRAAGVLVSTAAQLIAFNAWPHGTYTFELGSTEFVASVVIPTPEIGLRGIMTEAGELLTGDVWIVGDNGIVVREDTDGAIRIDIVGDPLFVRKLCQPLELFNPPTFLRTINGCPPNEHGEFHLVVGGHLAGDTVLRILPAGEAALKIEAVGKVN